MHPLVAKLALVDDVDQLRRDWRIHLGIRRDPQAAGKDQHGMGATLLVRVDEV